jgi:hypothetical protein
MLLVFILLFHFSLFPLQCSFFLWMLTYNPTFQMSVLHYYGSNVFRSVTVILYLRYMFPVVRMWFMTCWFQASQFLFGLVFSPDDESRRLSKRCVFSDNGKCPGTYQWCFPCSNIVKRLYGSGEPYSKLPTTIFIKFLPYAGLHIENPV